MMTCFHCELRAAGSSLWLLGAAQLGVAGKGLCRRCLPSFCCVPVRAVTGLSLNCCSPQHRIWILRQI